MAADISPFIEDAKKLQDKTGVPASITLAQVILESSGKYAGGLSKLGADAKNLFGVKGSGSAGSYTIKTREVINGKSVYVNAAFRKYNSYYESLEDHARLLTNNHYKPFLSNAKTVNDYAKGLQKAGYATDPEYANKLIKIIQSNGLDKYDTGNMKFTPLAGGGSTSGSSSTSTASTASSGDGTGTIIQKVFKQGVRVVLVFLIFILAVIFFMRAFPVVEDVASNVTPVGKVTKISKKVLKK